MLPTELWPFSIGFAPPDASLGIGFRPVSVAFIFFRKRIEFDRKLKVSNTISKLATSVGPRAELFTFRNFSSIFLRHFPTQRKSRRKGGFPSLEVDCVRRSTPSW